MSSTIETNPKLNGAIQKFGWPLMLIPAILHRTKVLHLILSYILLVRFNTRLMGARSWPYLRISLYFHSGHDILGDIPVFLLPCMKYSPFSSSSFGILDFVSIHSLFHAANRKRPTEANSCWNFFTLNQVTNPSFFPIEFTQSLE